MEIIINGPGGTVSTWVLNEAQYNYWKDKSRKFIFDYRWNLPDMREGNHFDDDHPPRDKLGVPDEAWFFSPRDIIWRGKGQEGVRRDADGWCLDVCEYDKAVIYIEDNNKITQHHPDEIPPVRFTKSYIKEPPSELFYSAVSTEIGNWQHKWYSKSIPIGKFRLHVIYINGKKWIFGLDTNEREDWDMYEMCHLDWSYRLHVRNKTFIEDMSTFTNIDLMYDMNTGDHEKDCSHFKVHDTRIR